MTNTENAQELLLEVFSETPTLDKKFILGEFAQAAFVNSEKLMQNRGSHHVGLKNNVLRKLDANHFNGQRVLDVASSALCAAKQLDDGTARVSKETFITTLKPQAKKQHLDMLTKQEKVAKGEITKTINEPVSELEIFSNPAKYKMTKSRLGLN